MAGASERLKLVEADLVKLGNFEDVAQGCSVLIRDQGKLERKGKKQVKSKVNTS